MTEFKRILAAVDFSDVSVRALQSALEVADKCNAHLDVVHTVSLDDINLPADASAAHNEKLIQQAITNFKDQLQQFVKEHISRGDDIDEHVCYGEPIKCINDMAKSLQSNMIVMGTHGRTGLSHLLMGSVAEGVLRNAEVPVLCIRTAAT